VQQFLVFALTAVKLDSKERLVTFVLVRGPMPEKQIVERLRADLEQGEARRAIRRLKRDQLIEAVRGLLALAKGSRPERRRRCSVVRAGFRHAGEASGIEPGLRQNRHRHRA
jgi:hypothetical protein